MKKWIIKYVVFTYLFFWLFIAFIGFVMLALKQEALVPFLQIISAWSPTIVFLFLFRKIYPENTLFGFIKKEFSNRIRLSDIIIPVGIYLFILVNIVLYFVSIEKVNFSLIVVNSPVMLAIIFIRSLLSGATGEELGWRSFLLAEFQKKYKPVQSAIIVGFIWGLWHIPLWFITGYTGINLFIYIVCFLISIVSASVVITFLYNKSGNLFSAIFYHFLFNFIIGIQSGDILTLLILVTILQFIPTVILILVNKKQPIYFNRKVLL